jgi:hypothetical protein
MLTQVGHFRVDEIARLSSKEHLSTVGSRCDACSLVDSVAHVALVGRVWSSRVDSHAHSNST